MIQNSRKVVAKNVSLLHPYPEISKWTGKLYFIFVIVPSVYKEKIKFEKFILLIV